MLLKKRNKKIRQETWPAIEVGLLPSTSKDAGVPDFGESLVVLQ